jgi:hypothetical protein
MQIILDKHQDLLSFVQNFGGNLLLRHISTGTQDLKNVRLPNNACTEIKIVFA